MDPLNPARTTSRPDTNPRARRYLTAAAPTVGAAIEVVGIATSPVIAAWLATDYGLAVVGVYFVLAAGVSFLISLIT